MMEIFGSLGVVAGSFGGLLLVAAVLWVLGTRAFKGEFSFTQALEVAGLASTIGILGRIITMLLVVVMGNTLATPGPALLIPDLDPSNPVHLALSGLNVMVFWQIGVLAVGLGTLSGVSAKKAGIWLFALWTVFAVAGVLVGSAAQKF